MRPYKSQYWLTSQDKREAPAQYQADVERLCDTYRDAPRLAAEGTHVASVDEKTGMQALERIVADQLDTHRSASLVELVARHCGIEEPLGVKGKTGILKSKHTRRAFLQDPTHQICFIYTPRHCSWLNQVEIWFSVLARRLLKRASFTSLEDLRSRVLDLSNYFNYFNDFLGKQFRWTYTGRPLQA